MGEFAHANHPEVLITGPELVFSQAQPERVLGSLALNSDEPLLLRVLNDRVEAEGVNPEESQALATYVHRTLILPFQRRNEQGNISKNSGLINPEVVERDLQRFYNVFTLWPQRIPAARLTQLRNDFMKENSTFAIETAASATSTKAIEVMKLLELRSSFAQHNVVVAKRATDELLTVFGWILRNDSRSRWKQLLRDTDNIHYDRE